MPTLYSRLLTSLALPWVSVFTESRFWPLYRQAATDPHSVLHPGEAKTLARLNDLIRHATETVPYYREHLRPLLPEIKEIRSLDDFRRLPIVTKTAIAENFPDRITTSNRRYRPWRLRSTSGTVERLTTVHDYRKRDYARAAELFGLYLACGYEPGMRYLELPPDICQNLCGVTDSVEPKLLQYFFQNLRTGKIGQPDVVSNLRGLAERQIMYRLLVLPSFGQEGIVQNGDKLDLYLRQIRNYRPTVVKALPAYLYALALHMQDRSLSPPRISNAIAPMGSSMTPHMKATIQNAFDCPVHEDYGSAELGAIGAECGHGQGIHPFSSMFCLEVVRDGQTVANGSVGKILITDLCNYAMPFIRYDIGDVAVVRRGRCRCGLETDRVEIQGRTHDCILCSNGTLLTPDVVTDTALRQPGVLAFQLVVHPQNRVKVSVVPRGAAVPNLKQVQDNLRELLGADFHVSIRLVRTILPEPGGKFRFVKNLANTADELFGKEVFNGRPKRISVS